MQIIINKNYFKNLSKGTHAIKVHFKNGYAQDTFTVSEAITFTILGDTFTATAGMTWDDWIKTGGSSTGNGKVTYGMNAIGNPIVYIDPRYKNDWAMSSGGLFSAEDELFNSSDVLQYASTAIVNGMAYGRSSNAPT